MPHSLVGGHGPDVDALRILTPRADTGAECTTIASDRRSSSSLLTPGRVRWMVAPLHLGNREALEHAGFCYDAQASTAPSWHTSGAE
jgi:hypothetical protein